MKRRNKKGIAGWGPKRPTRTVEEVCAEADECANELKRFEVRRLSSVSVIRAHFAFHSRRYYALAALSRRKVLPSREDVLRRLFTLRVLLERRMFEFLDAAESFPEVLAYATRPTFFGRSIKQGVSIRYALATCVPTQRCGGRCYAHDGRDRDLQRVFRGVLNWHLGASYERGSSETRKLIMDSLSRAIDEAIDAARRERDTAAKEGFRRDSRIRFSHVGEMVATPQFVNDLAREIRRRAPDVNCIAYTRHPYAHLLEDALFVVNFTVDGRGDDRAKYRPRNARLVSSSWDGQLLNEADVNFIEHHVEKSTKPSGSGISCPVTLNHHLTPTCDSARCDKCFSTPLIQIGARHD